MAEIGGRSSTQSRNT